MYHTQIKKGFLLFEILIALAIFSTACLIMACQRWKIIKQEQEAFDRLQALTLAHNTMESIGNNRQFYVSDQQTKRKFTIKYQIEPFPIRLTQNLLMLKNFKLIKIFVTWQSSMGIRSVRLTSGFNLQ